MKPFPISVQLYSVRKEAERDFPAVLEQIAKIGYVGVEFAGLHGMTPAEVKKVLDRVGLVTSSCHGPLPTEENLESVVEMARTLGFTRHVTGFGPNQFATKDGTLEAAVMLRKAAGLLNGTGITLGVHNHWWEFDKLFEGRYPHELLMEAAPAVFAEVDTYWVKVAGADPAKVLDSYGDRAPLVHVKDGPGNREQAMTAAGKGIMDWPSIIAAANPNTEWLVVELDRCDTDMMEAVAESYAYLTKAGLARGRR